MSIDLCAKLTRKINDLEGKEVWMSRKSVNSRKNDLVDSHKIVWMLSLFFWECATE